MLDKLNVYLKRGEVKQEWNIKTCICPDLDSKSVLFAGVVVTSVFARADIN